MRVCERESVRACLRKREVRERAHEREREEENVMINAIFTPLETLKAKQELTMNDINAALFLIRD